MPPDFFFDFFAVGEMWSAMDMSAIGRKDTRQCQHLSLCATYVVGASEARDSDGRFHDHNRQSLELGTR